MCQKRMFLALFILQRKINIFNTYFCSKKRFKIILLLDTFLI